MHADPDEPAGLPEVSDTAAVRALSALRGAYPAFAPGEVWLVGAGPGDPGLLTLDALAGLIQADVVVHDALVDPRVLALARRGAQIRFAGKRGGKPSMAQADISTLLIELARSGLRVLRLKGGDPFVFGRGGEEMLALASRWYPVARHSRRDVRAGCTRERLDTRDHARHQSVNHLHNRAWCGR